jgi:tetratricopeptide (TPR) repeat protein
MSFRRPLLMLVLLLLACAAGARGQSPAEPPPFDPLHAEKNIEVGNYYMKKGNYDAAIERFQEAARLKPNFARPYRLLGEAYEKKGDKAEAVKAYRKYLEILPAAEDASKIHKRVEKLSRELERAARRRSG